MSQSALSATANFVRFGQRLKALRNANRLTLKQLSEATGISIPYLSNLERAYAPKYRGRVAPSAAKLEALSEALKITRSEMYRELGLLPEGETGFSSVAPGPPPDHLDDATRAAIMAETAEEIKNLKKQMLSLELKYESLTRQSGTASQGQHSDFNSDVGPPG